MREKLKVLYLEDNREDFGLVQRELRDLATVQIATDGESFKALLKQQAWDVILVDFALPRFSGQDAIAAIKQTCADTPVVICSGSINDQSASAYLRSGAVDYLLKDRLGRLPEAVRQAHENHMLRRQAMRDNRLEILGHTTAGFTHDWNNLLQAFVGGPEILRKILPDYVNPLPESVERVLSAMESSGRRGVDMSRQVTAFIRGANGNALKAVAPEYILTELRKLLRESFPKNIQLSTRTVPGTEQVKCDVTEIVQLLLNLAVNARDAMPHGGGLFISAQNSAPGKVVFQVRDTGTGIKPEHMSRIWEYFWTTKPVGHGTGLGLPMAKKIAMDHGGDITVESSPEGTSFFLYLPVAVNETRAEKVTRMEEFDGQGKVILIVDDEAHMRLLVEMFLLDANYKPLVAGSGMEALSYFRSNPNIDLLLTDCGMPLMSGQELAELLRVQGFTMPIVYLTGAAEVDAFDPPPDGILKKPFTRSELLGALQSVLTSAEAKRKQGT